MAAKASRSRLKIWLCSFEHDLQVPNLSTPSLGERKPIIRIIPCDVPPGGFLMVKRA